jgi:hypothetical protein
MVYLHTIWTFTLMERSNVVRYWCLVLNFKMQHNFNLFQRHCKREGVKLQYHFQIIWSCVVLELYDIVYLSLQSSD